MKVTIDLNYEVMLAIGASVANKCAIEWFNGSVQDNNEPVAIRDMKTLYQYAFADGMRYLMELIENKDTE